MVIRTLGIDRLADRRGRDEAPAVSAGASSTFIGARPSGYLVVTRPGCGRVAPNHAAGWYSKMLVGMEVKATAAPGPADARHLAGLRDRYPDTFVAGVVLHTGPRAYGLGERLAAVPISALWGG